MNRADYQRYLASREWAVKKQAVRRRSGGLCERCHLRPHEQTHHLTYERLGHELLEDLLGVCEPCHAFLSGRRGTDPASVVLGAASEFAGRRDVLPDGSVRILSANGVWVHFKEDPGIFWECLERCPHPFEEHGPDGCRQCACKHYVRNAAS